jgi:branched-chain amino acid transport system substrate-binding protein
LLPPWGTGINLAVGPTFNKHNFPQLTFSAVTDRAPELAKRWPNSFWFLGTSKQYVDALVELLVKLRKEGKINDQIAMVSVADGFGIDLSKAARAGFEKAGFKIVFDKSYPVGTQDMAPIVGEAERSKADTFVAFSYPPDTVAIVDQARLTSYAPKMMFTGVGTFFPLFPQRFGDNAEGVVSLGGWSKDNKATMEYREKIRKIVNRDPDYWGSQIGYSSLQMLEQAIERVGSLDRTAIIKELQNRHLRHRDRQDQAREQHAEGRLLAARPVAGRPLCRCCAAASGRGGPACAEGSLEEIRERHAARRVPSSGACRVAFFMNRRRRLSSCSRSRCSPASRLGASTH